MVIYTYDSWGNYAVVKNTSGIAELNPFRYRGYYYDTETDLYFLQTRYYDPEIGRFISQDDVSYLDPESINGLNLYAYCSNNPVMRVDPNGNDWWHWLIAAVAVVALCAIAVGVTALTGGASSFAFTVALGALKGSAIGFGVGAVAGTAIGAVAGGIYSAVTGADLWSSVGQGALLGLGIGAFAGAAIGAVIGGVSGANGWYNARALELTNVGSSNEVVLGHSSDGYSTIAQSRNATYFHTSDVRWAELEKQVGRRGMEKINRIFLKNQIAAGKTFTLISNPTGLSSGYLFKELAYLSSKYIGYLVAFI